ncbi:hypothetical protein A8L45_00010 [Veronia pacifica]|uniref:Uncharacterized protein n=1 Tax=Veronia pacifica TaxID=1080227 RepID=A0A1C3ES33_9GAMM|nr:hypothetical protein A8L45_00010 [Veronia pacifica]
MVDQVGDFGFNEIDPLQIKASAEQYKSKLAYYDTDRMLCEEGLRLLFVAISNVKTDYIQLTDVPFQNYQFGIFAP